MEEEECSMLEMLAGTIGATITAIQEEEDAVIFYLNDHQRFTVIALDDGGFNINVEERKLH